MEIVDLTDEHRELFHLCLEDWSEEAREAGPRRGQWVEQMLPRGLRAKLALDAQGRAGGMIQALPIEQSVVDGQDLWFVPCVWVHGHKQGRGRFQGQGMGRALLAAVEEEARAAGARGIAAWGVWLPFWMKASWFKRQGFRKADRQGLAVLLWKPFAAGARPPRWFRPTSRRPELVEGKVTVTAFVNGWCMAQNLICERARRAAEELGERVVFRAIDTSDRAVVAEWGISDAVFVDHQRLRSGPPPSYETIRKLIARRLRRL